MFKFRYEPKFEDYLFLNRHVQGPFIRLFFTLAIGVIALTVALPFLAAAMGNKDIDWPSFWRAMIPLLVIALSLPLIFVLIRYTARKRWNAAEELRVPRDYEISEEGIQMSGGSISGKMEWRHITQAELADGFVLLKTAQNQFYYFPTARVQNPDALLALISRHVTKTKNWKKV
jgi:hypothetical protein